MNLRLETSTDGDTATVRIDGDLDYTTAATFVDTVSALLADRPGLRDLRLDCAPLTFCDSRGMSALLETHHMTTLAGARLHLDNRSARLERVLGLTGVLDYLLAPVDVDEAPDEAAG